MKIVILVWKVKTTLLSVRKENKLYPFLFVWVVFLIEKCSSQISKLYHARSTERKQSWTSRLEGKSLLAAQQWAQHGAEGESGPRLCPASAPGELARGRTL